MPAHTISCGLFIYHILKNLRIINCHRNRHPLPLWYTLYITHNTINMKQTIIKAFAVCTLVLGLAQGASASVIDQAFTNMSTIKSGSMSGHMEYISANKKDYFYADLKSKTDGNDQSAIKVDQSITMSTSEMPFQIAISIRMIGDTLYMQIPNLPFDSFMPELVPYKGQWVRFNPQDIATISNDIPGISDTFNQLTKLNSGTLASTNTAPTPEAIKARQELMRYFTAFTLTKKGSRVSNGIKQDKYAITLNTKKLIAILTADIKKEYEGMPASFINSEIKSMKDDVAHTVLKSATLYVGQQDKLPYDLAFTIVNLTKKNKIDSTLNISLQFSDYGTIFTDITAPTSFVTGTDMYNKIKASFLDSMSEVQPLIPANTQSTKKYSVIESVATDMGISSSRFETCMDNNETNQTVLNQEALGDNINIQGTPTSIIMVASTGQQIQIQGAQPYDSVKSIIDKALSGNVLTLSDDQKPRSPTTLTGTDHINGYANAPVVIVEYSDSDCPYCKAFHTTLHQLQNKYGNQIAWVYRHYPLDSLHPKARMEAQASECVAKLSDNATFWKYLDSMFTIDSSN